MLELTHDCMLVLTTLLLSQHTALALHALPVPTPITLIGEQSRPTRAVISWMTMPKRPRMAATPASLACVARVQCQHQCQTRKGVAKATYALDLLATLDRARRARLTRLELDRGGSRENGEGGNGDSSEAREHRDRGERRWGS